MRKKGIKKAALKNDKLKTEIKQIRADLIKLKKSKKRMQLLWYRTKKEHVALLKDLDQRLKVLKKKTGIKKPTQKKPALKKQVNKTHGKKAETKKK